MGETAIPSRTDIRLQPVKMGGSIGCEWYFEVPLPPLKELDRHLVENAFHRTIDEWNLLQVRTREVTYAVSGDSVYAQLPYKVSGTGHVEGGFSIQGQDLILADGKLRSRHVTSRAVAERLIAVGIMFANHLEAIRRGSYVPASEPPDAVKPWHWELIQLEVAAQAEIIACKGMPFTPEDDAAIRRFFGEDAAAQAEGRFALCARLRRPWSEIEARMKALLASA